MPRKQRFKPSRKPKPETLEPMRPVSDQPKAHPDEREIFEPKNDNVTTREQEP